MTGGLAEHGLEFGGAVGLGSNAAQKLWKKGADDAEPRPLQIEYNTDAPPNEDSQIFEDLELPVNQKVAETVFEDPEEADIRPRLLVPLQSVLGLKALCEREYIRTEAVTEMLNQCRTAYYKELLYLREQLILAAEPEKQLMLSSVQNYEVYYFNPPAYVDEDLREYILNCSRWTHKKLIEENYELQMKLAGQEDVFDNADFCLKGLLRRHGVYKMFKIMHNIVKHAKDLFNPEDLIRKKETEGLKPLDELQAAVVELFPNLKAKEDTSGLLLAEIEELQKNVTDLRAELAKVKDLLEKERTRADNLNRKCEEQMKLMKPAEVEVVKPVETGATLEEMKQLQDEKQRLEQEAEAQARRLRKALSDFASAKSLETGSAKADPGKLVPKLDEAVADAEQLLAAAAKLPAQVITRVQGSAPSVDRSGEEKALKEVKELKAEVESLKGKLAAAEKREHEALQKLKALQNAKKPEQVDKSEPTGPAAVPSDYEEIKERLERKLARIAELEADLDQAKRDLRVANRKIEEQDLLLQEKARKDADHAKKMSDLMEKLRKSEEEAENLAGKLYNAQEKIKKLKEEIRELKNKLGMAVVESEEEEEEEPPDPASFMSRYYLRAKNSGKPRWMLLSEDAKMKSQRTEHQQQRAHQHVGGGAEAANALHFLRRAPSSESQKHTSGSRVRMQYASTQEWYVPDPGDYSPMPTPMPAQGGFSRQGSFQMGHSMTDGSAISPGAAPRLHNQGSVTFAQDVSPHALQHSFSRQGTASMAGIASMVGSRTPGSPFVGGSRQGTPPTAMPQGGLQSTFNRQGTSPLAAFNRQGTSPLAVPQGGGLQSTFNRPGAQPGAGLWQTTAGQNLQSGHQPRSPGHGLVQSPLGVAGIGSHHLGGGQRHGTPPGAPELLGGPRRSPSPTSPSPGVAGELAAGTRLQGVAVAGVGTSPASSPTSRAPLPFTGMPADSAASMNLGLGLGTESLALQPAEIQPSAEPMAGPLQLPAGREGVHSSSSSSATSDIRHPDFRHAHTMSPCRLHRVGLASQDGDMLQLVPQEDFMVGPASSSPSRQRGPVALQPLLQDGPAVMSMPVNHWGEGGDASLGLGGEDVVPRRILTPEFDSQAVPLWRKQDLKSEGGSTRATDQSSPVPSRESQVPRPPLHKAPTTPVLPGSGSPSPPQRGGLTASKTSSSFRQVDTDMIPEPPIARVQTSPVAGGSGLDSSQKVMSWAATKRPNAPKPLTNGGLAQGRGRLPPHRSFSTSTLESGVEYVSADALPRLPAGRVKKAAPPPSWLSPVF